MKKKIIITLILGVLVAVGFIVLLNRCCLNTAVSNVSEECKLNGYCTKEEEKVINKETEGIEGVMTIGPTCPVMRIPPDPSCDDRPYVVPMAIYGKSSGKLMKTFTPNADGTFKVPVPAGDYIIRPDAKGNTMPYFTEIEITVHRFEFTNLNLQFDSGIR